jgi:hypothetical protein
MTYYTCWEIQEIRSFGLDVFLHRFLDHNSISGPIPDTIGGLPLLQRLDLSGNQFNGTIPRTLGDLRDLYFV